MVTEEKPPSLEGHQPVGSALKLCWFHFILHTGRVPEVRSRNDPEVRSRNDTEERSRNDPEENGKDRREKLTLEGRGGWEYIWLTAFR